MRNALVLNASYEPLSVVSARRATCLVLSAKADLVAHDGTAMRSPSITVASPLVIRLRYMVKVPFHRRTALSRRAVFARDDYRCQYCGDHADSIDHVMPRSRGGDHAWENVAAACRPCNLEQAGPDPRRGRHAPRPTVPGAAGVGLGGGQRQPGARGLEAVSGPGILTP